MPAGGRTRFLQVKVSTSSRPGIVSLTIEWHTRCAHQPLGRSAVDCEPIGIVEIQPLTRVQRHRQACRVIDGGTDGSDVTDQIAVSPSSAHRDDLVIVHVLGPRRVSAELKVRTRDVGRMWKPKASARRPSVSGGHK